VEEGREEADGRRLVTLHAATGSVAEAIERHGHVPLPPYIRRPDTGADRERYQTVYAREAGSVAAPTAGLHLSPRLFAALHARGVRWTEVVLHVGPGTFQPVRAERVEDHRLPAEPLSVPEEAARAVNAARSEGRRVIAVGTTSVRVLESAAGPEGGGARVDGLPGLFRTLAREYPEVILRYVETSPDAAAEGRAERTTLATYPSRKPVTKLPL